MTTFFAWYLKSADINATLSLKGNTETVRNETSMCKQPIQRRARSNRLQKHTRPVTDTLNSHTITNTWPWGLLKEPSTLNFQQLTIKQIRGQTVKLTLHNSCWMTRTSWNVPSEMKLSRIYTPTTATAGALGLSDILKEYCVQCSISAVWVIWEKKAEELSNPRLSRLRSAHCGGQNIHFS